MHFSVLGVQEFPGTPLACMRDYFRDTPVVLHEFSTIIFHSISSCLLHYSLRMHNCYGVVIVYVAV